MFIDKLKLKDTNFETNFFKTNDKGRRIYIKKLSEDLINEFSEMYNTI